MENRKIERDVQPFLNSFRIVLLNVMLPLSIAGIVGIETSSFVGVLGAADLAIGLTLQSSLANFAGGVIILNFKPYRVGDLINAQGAMFKASTDPWACIVLSRCQPTILRE